MDKQTIEYYKKEIINDTLNIGRLELFSCYIDKDNQLVSICKSDADQMIDFLKSQITYNAKMLIIGQDIE